MSSLNWRMNLYKSGTDPTAAPYATVPLTTIQALPTYAALQNVYIIAPQAKHAIEVIEQVDIGGWKQTTLVDRQSFEVICYPFWFNDSSTSPDLTDIDTIADFIRGAKHLWMQIRAGSRTYPSSLTNVIPVSIVGWDESPDLKSGTRTVVITIEAKGLS